MLKGSGRRRISDVKAETWLDAVCSARSLDEERPNPTFPFSTVFLNLRFVAIISIYAGLNAMKTLRRSVPNG
jgi:hypothetical protein